MGVIGLEERLVTRTHHFHYFTLQTAEAEAQKVTVRLPNQAHIPKQEEGFNESRQNICTTLQTTPKRLSPPIRNMFLPTHLCSHQCMCNHMKNTNCPPAKLLHKTKILHEAMRFSCLNDSLDF